MIEDYKKILDEGARKAPFTLKFFKWVKKNKPKDLDVIVSQLHAEVFEEIDCLKCANCCASLGPRVSDRDIDKIATHLRIKPSTVSEKYLKIDEDNDFVFSSMPCPFLAADNYCHIYPSRPKACAEYPHTDRRRFIQLLDLTNKNAQTCPAVCLIIDKLANHYKYKTT